ncbi:MAG: heme biosynthesis protein HemY [Janthinobacterium lividum]
MTPTPRRLRLAAAISLMLIAAAAQAQTNVPSVASPSITPSAKETPQPSALTATLFYEVLIGELTANGGDPGDGYALLLDAARRTKDSALFERAIEIALQSRSGDAALAAARAWQQSVPDSRDGRRYELQILVALNRLEETAEPLRAEIAATPLPERPLLMSVIARNYSRATDKKLASSVVEKALVDDLANPTTAGLAWTTVGRMRFVAGDTAGALDAALKAQAADPKFDGPSLLALDLMGPDQPLAEPIVKRYLSEPEALPEIRIAYARTLMETRRYAEATTQLTTLTTAYPALPGPWILLGIMQVQARQDIEAEKSILRYVDLVQARAESDEARRGLPQAYLLLSQIAERRKDFSAAGKWLARIDSSEEPALGEIRRAGLLARQGKAQQAREIIRSLPQTTPAEVKQRQQAEFQVLRDAKEYQAAYDLLAQATTTSPDDADAVYDQAMMAEKLNRLGEMERLLRRVIELRPDNPNAYNALGYLFADHDIRLDEARTLIQKAVTLAPQDPFIADSLGWVEFKLGNAAEARRILELAYQRRPDPEIGAHLGEVLWSAGERDQALRIWRESTLADADNETLQETLKRLRVKP